MILFVTCESKASKHTHGIGEFFENPTRYPKTHLAKVLKIDVVGVNEIASGAQRPMKLPPMKLGSFMEGIQ